MTPVQREYYAWINTYRATHGRWPRHRETAEHFGVSDRVAREHVYELVKLKSLPARKRGRPGGQPGPTRLPVAQPRETSRAPGQPKTGFSVMLSVPNEKADRFVASVGNYHEARARAKALNDELNAEEGIPRHDGGPFAFYYVSGKYCGMPAHLADRLDEEAEAREAS